MKGNDQMNHYKLYRTISIRVHNVPEAVEAGFQASLENLLRDHDLIVEKHPWEKIAWKIQPTTDRAATVEIVVSEMTDLNAILIGLNNLALEERFMGLMPTQFTLKVVEEPTLTVETTLHEAWLSRNRHLLSVHSKKTLAKSEAPSSRPAACRNNSAATRVLVRKAIQNQEHWCSE